MAPSLLTTHIVQIHTYNVAHLKLHAYEFLLHAELRKSITATIVSEMLPIVS